LYLTEKTVQLRKIPTVCHTHKCVFTSHSSAVRFRSTQKKADTLMILHALALGDLGITVQIYSSDTGVLCWRWAEFQSSVQRESSSWWCPVKLQPICYALKRQHLYQGFMHLLVQTWLDTSHESENLHATRPFWKPPTIWPAPLAALGLERIHQTRCCVAVNSSSVSLSTIQLWRRCR